MVIFVDMTVLYLALIQERHKGHSAKLKVILGPWYSLLSFFTIHYKWKQCLQSNRIQGRAWSTS